MYNDGQMQQPAADHTMGHSIFRWVQSLKSLVSNLIYMQNVK